LNRKLLAFIVAFLLTCAAKAQTAAISANPTSGCAPLPVQFKDASTGATSWSWDFGDGIGKSTVQNPGLYTYLTAGTFTVTLTINGSIKTTQTIAVNKLPSVSFKVDDSTGCFPLAVNFTDMSNPGSGTITGWAWDFGDGQTSNLKNPSHTYKGAANYPVTLNVTNSNGCSNAYTHTGYIQIPNGVTATFNTVAASGCKLPITVQFNNTSTGPGTLTYTWSFGDASGTTNTTSPGHTYGTSGTYNVELIASSTAGCTDSLTVPTPILAGNVTSSFTAPDTVCVGSLINFLNTSAPKPTVVNWDFGDGTSSSALGPTKTYNVAKIYTVKLTNTFGACIDSVSKQITVLTPAVANFIANDTVSCDSLFTVQFQDQSSTASSWSWSFGDGSNSNQQNPLHTYKGYGLYTVTLTVSNSVGCSGTITKSQYIQNRKPFIQLNTIGSKGCAPFSFSPTLIDTVVDGIASYVWDFGDGTNSTVASPPAHSYPNAGTFYVKLNITTNTGCTASITDTVQVGTIKPVVSFTASPTTVCTNAGVTFVDHSTNSPNAWLWTFGDGNTSTLENPVYGYNTPGTYTVTLRAYINGCNDSATTKIVVNPPQAKFAYTYSCSGNNTVFVFHDSSKGADTWTWDFGDGTPVSNVQNPTHSYAVVDSSYSVTLTVKNNATGCTNSSTQQVFIVRQKGNFNTNQNNVCVNTQIFISVTGIVFSNFSSFTYDFGDGTILNAGYNGVGSHTYKKAGKYTVSVILTELTGCKDTVTKVNYIQVNGPTAQFTTSAFTGCTGLSAVFIDQSTTDGINPITKWVWDYGDSSPIQTYSAPPFTHNYTKQGIYTVKLKVSDASGCTDSISKINLITVAYPDANFTTIDSQSCPGSPVQFVNNSKGYGLTYNWDLGDGNTSTALNPTHIYPIGTYKVSLRVIDQFGCLDSSLNYNIVIDTPSASFTLTDTFASCPPLVDTFTFTGSYYKSLKWVFGDGGISSLLPPQSPVHYYNIPGTYSPYLVVTSHGGCTATAPARTVKILGPYGALSYSPLQGCHTLTVNFNVVTGNIVKYLWVFSNTQTDSTNTPSISFTYDSIGKYLPIVVLEDPSGCNVPIYGSDTIYIIGSTPKFGYDKSTFCANGTVQFSDSTTSTGTIGSYFWDFGDGNTSTSQNPSHPYSAPGLYSVKLVVTTTTGCKDSITQNNLIKVVASPVIDITGAASQCVPATLNFQGTETVADTSAIIWAWNFYNGQPSSSLQNPPAQTYAVAGSDSVMLKATNSSGCTDSVSKYFTIYPLPPTYAGADTTICVAQSASLSASGAATYNWLPPNNTLSCTNCASPTATPDSTTTYVVSGTSAFGCVYDDTVVVTVIQPASLSLTPLTDSICLGQSVILNASGEALYTWSPTTGLSNPSIANPSASPDTTTTYQVTGTDIKSCFTNTQSVTITVFNYPKIDVGANVTIPIGTSYQISGNGSSDIDSISWTPTIGLSCTTCLSPLASPLTTTTYVVSVDNTGGCVATDSITIIVTCDNKNLFVPNTFSPNGDGVNDAFFVSGKGLSTIQSMRVFNRWGQIVFEKRNFAPNDPNAGWDGTFNGRKAPVDVYIYTIEVICENSQVVAYHGNVALIR
jgi:gliding motility-associated-like protein